MSNYAIPTVNSNSDRIIIHCGTNNLHMVEPPEAIAEKTIELAKSITSTANEVMISSIIARSDKLDDKGSKMNSIVENFRKKDETIEFLLIQRNILERMALPKL